MKINFRQVLLFMCFLSNSHQWTVKLDSNIETQIQRSDQGGSHNTNLKNDIYNSTFVNQVIKNHTNEVWSTGFFLLMIGFLAGMQGIVLYKTAQALIRVHMRLQAIEMIQSPQNKKMEQNISSLETIERELEKLKTLVSEITELLRDQNSELASYITKTRDLESELLRKELKITELNSQNSELKNRIRFLRLNATFTE